MAYNFALDTSLLLTEELHDIEDRSKALEREREEFAMLDKTFVQAFRADSALPKPDNTTYCVNREGSCVLRLVWGYDLVGVEVHPNKVRVHYADLPGESDLKSTPVIYTAPYDKQAIEDEILRRINWIHEQFPEPPEWLYLDYDELAAINRSDGAT
jgi:hypothetical protein